MSSGALPAGLGLASSTGVLSGTPTTAGTSSFTIRATNAAGFDAQATSVAVPAGPAPDPDPGPASSSSPVVVPAPGVTRYGGNDRVGTAVTLSQQLMPVAGSATSAVIATSAAFADALVGARLASASAAPMLISSPGDLDPQVAAETKRLVAPGGTIYVLGDTQALSPSVATSLAALSSTYTITRIGGEDRYATAVEIADRVTSQATGTGPIYVVDGTNYPDGLAASALAAHTGGVVVLSRGDRLPEVTKAYLSAHDPTGARTIPVGGPAAHATANLTAAGANALVGKDRYDTSRLVAAQFATPGAAGVRTVGLASGSSWADSLVASAAMGDLGDPLLLTSKEGLPTATLAAMGELNARTAITTGLVFGGPDAISPEIQTAFTTLITKK